MIKVLHLITGLYTGGAERFLARLVGQMGSGFENLVVSLGDRGTLGAQIEAAGIRVETLRMNRLWPGPAGILKLGPLLRREQPQIIQTWLYHADLFGLLFGHVFAPRAKIVWNIRNSNIDLARRSLARGLMFRALARLSGQVRDVVTNSRVGQAYHSEHGYHPLRWHLIPNGFDANSWRPDPTARVRLRREWGIPPDACVFGHVARFDPMKGHIHLIESASIFLRNPDIPPVYFVLAGRGVSMENLKLAAAVRGTGFADRFRLLGEQADIAALNAATDVALSASLYGEGFPNALGEAMACGVPCIATDTGDSSWVLGDTGSLVPPGDCARLAGAMASWARMDSTQRAAAGARARERIVREFSLEKVVESYRRLYTSILT